MALVCKMCVLLVMTVSLVCGRTLLVRDSATPPSSVYSMAVAEARRCVCLCVCVCPPLPPPHPPPPPHPRYLYLTSGALPAVAPAAHLRDLLPMNAHQVVVIAAATSPLLGGLDPAWVRGIAADPQAHALRTEDVNGTRVHFVVGGGDVGVLYGAYRLAELLGVRFRLSGDVLPPLDPSLALALPALHDTAVPTFATRGLQPFHDFDSGPDWWTAEDYKAIIGQIAKQRMNFIGLHTCMPV